MKRVLLTLALVLSFLSVYAADTNFIATAFKSGNAALLNNCMDKEVEMVLPSVNKKCAGNEAVKLLESFFKQYKPTNFSVLHQVDKKESGFYVAKYIAGSTEYRVNITYRVNGNAIVIQSIRIE